MKKIVFITLLGFCSIMTLHAQKYPEHRYIRGGNRLYDKGNFTASERLYQTAFDLNPHSPEAAYNLGNALYKQGRWEDAAKSYSYLLSDTTLREKAAPAFYNAGNAQFQQRQLEQALESYKNSLRLNPGDEQAKFNLAYVKKLLDNNKKDGGGGNNDKNKDQQDQNKQDQNKDQQNKNDQNKQDQDKQNPDKSDQNKDKQNGDGQQPKPSGMNKEEADQMLDAMQRQEDNTQEKVKAQKAKAVKRSAKNW